MIKLNIIIETPLLIKDYKRFGISYLSKNFKIVIIDISYLTKKKIHHKLRHNEYISNNKDNFKINSIKSIGRLLEFMKKNKNELCIDYLSDIPINQILRYGFFLFKFKLIKTSHGMHPTKLPNYKNYKFFLSKILSLSSWINFLSNKIQFNYWYIYIISCNKAEKIRKSKYIIYSHTFDYDTFLEFKKIKSTVYLNSTNDKKRAVFIDQNLADNPDFLITNNKTVKRDSYYNAIKLFFEKLDHKKWDFQIALHPKNEIKNIQKYFFNYKLISDNTINVINNSDVIFCHYSTALNFAYLFKKPIIVIYTNEMKDKVYFYRSISALCDYHKITPLNITNFKSNDIEINDYSNTSKYDRYINDYIKHPKSSNDNMWEQFTKFIFSYSS